MRSENDGKTLFPAILLFLVCSRSRPGIDPARTEYLSEPWWLSELLYSHDFARINWC